MSNPIGWCDVTINPIVGCSHCSPGCDNCYAEKFAARLTKNPKTAKKYAGVVDENGKWNGSVRYHVSWYEQLSKKPKRIFLGSMSDLFHPAVIEEDLHEILDLIVKFGCQHTFLVLTKRPERARDMLACRALPPNVWLGVTVCNQEEADAKIPVLLQIPAAKRFVSVEPMLGPVNLGFRRAPTDRDYWGWDGDGPIDYVITIRADKLHWVICGGETGPGARPMHPEWARSLRDQCVAAGVPFYFKGWGDWLPCSQVSDDFDDSRYPVGDIGNDGIFIPHPILAIPLRNGVCTEDTIRVGKKRAGRLLDGREWNEIPGA